MKMTKWLLALSIVLASVSSLAEDSLIVKLRQSKNVQENLKNFYMDHKGNMNSGELIADSLIRVDVSQSLYFFTIKSGKYEMCYAAPVKNDGSDIETFNASSCEEIIFLLKQDSGGSID